VEKKTPLLVDTGLAPAPAQGEMLTRLRQAVAQRLGSLAGDMLAWPGGESGTMMIIGGDTLAGFLQRRSSPRLRLEGECAPGVAAFSLEMGAGRRRLLSKSGGFGEEALLEHILHMTNAK